MSQSVQSGDEGVRLISQDLRDSGVQLLSKFAIFSNLHQRRGLVIFQLLDKLQGKGSSHRMRM